VPYTLLPDSFDPIDYARTSIDNVTAMTFPGTDLVIQQPTAYNEWFQIAVFTTTPDLSAHPSQSETGMTAWPASMCGSYEYDYDTVTQTITSGGEVTTTKSTMSTPRSSRLVPSGKDYSWLFLAAFFGGTKDVDDLNVTYIEPQATPWDGGKALVDYPTGLLGWLGGQEDIVAKHPYITDCFTVGHGDGQPTVHVPVNALTVTSSHIIDVRKAPSPTTSPSALKPTQSAHTEIEDSFLDQPPSPSPTTSPSAVKPTESAHTEIEDSFLDQPPSPSPTTSPSAVKPTETAHTEIEETALDQPPSQSPTTTSTSAVKPAESAHTEIEETSLDQPHPSNTITILDPSAVTTTASAPHTENQGSSLDLPAPPPSPSATKQTRETSPNIPGMTVHTEPEHTSVGGPKTTDSRMPKAHTEQSEPVLDVPTRSQIFTYRPSSALPAQASDAAAGKESSSSRPGGVVVVADDDDKNDNDSKQQPSQGSSSDGNDNNNGQNNGIGGLISAIQSVASQQAAASPGSQENTQDDDASVRPAAAVTDNNASGPRPSITGFVVGSQTLTPGGGALTQGGRTFTALPSGSGLQVVAQSSTLRLDGVVPPGMFAVPGVVQKPDSEDEYLVGNNAVSAGGSAVTVEKETFSALPGGSGVQVVNGDGQTRTESVVAVASIDSSPVRSGEDDGQYVFGGNTLSVGGQALTIDGTTFSALPSLSGVAVVDEGQTSTASLGGTVDFLTVTGASVTAFATPVLLPGGGENNNGGDSDQQLVTLSGSTYTALATKGSLLVVDGQTVNPGETIVIHGETVVLSGTSLVVAKATASSTHGLGDAIISGLGGGSSSSSSSLSGDDEDETASSSSGPNAEETGASSDGASNDGSDYSTTDQSGAVPGVQVAVGCLVASAVFALALM
jgi:hypothetical protein